MRRSIRPATPARSQKGLPIAVHRSLTTADDTAVVGQRLRHAQCAVAGEGADLDDPSRTHQFDQQCHELTPLRGDLHPCHLVFRGLFAQLAHQRRLAQRVGEQVVVQPVVQAQRAVDMVGHLAFVGRPTITFPAPGLPTLERCRSPSRRVPPATGSRRHGDRCRCIRRCRGRRSTTAAGRRPPRRRASGWSSPRIAPARASASHRRASPTVGKASGFAPARSSRHHRRHHRT